MGYTSKQKGYKYFNPTTQLVWVSQEDIFDESETWYEPNSTLFAPTEEELDDNSDGDIQQWPQEPASTKSITWLRSGIHKGKSKMPNYEVGHPDKSDLDMSAHSLHSVYGKPIMRMPGIKKAMTSTNEKLLHSSQEKNLVTWFGSMSIWHITMPSWWRSQLNESRKVFRKQLMTIDGLNTWMKKCKH